MGRGKQHLVKNQIIQKEQLQLLKIQKELESILGKVNETINELKVEELQLKSSAVAALSAGLQQQQADGCHASVLELPSTSAKSGLVDVQKTVKREPQLEAELVNQQKIDLQTFALSRSAMEEEEEEDVDCM